MRCTIEKKKRKKKNSTIWPGTRSQRWGEKSKSRLSNSRACSQYVLGVSCTRNMIPEKLISLVVWKIIRGLEIRVFRRLEHTWGACHRFSIKCKFLYRNRTTVCDTCYTKFWSRVIFTPANLDRSWTICTHSATKNKTGRMFGYLLPRSSCAPPSPKPRKPSDCTFRVVYFTTLSSAQAWVFYGEFYVYTYSTYTCTNVNGRHTDYEKDRRSGAGKIHPLERGERGRTWVREWHQRRGFPSD